jgi:hypothetical protein
MTRHNFITVKDPSYFKQQIEEMHATEAYGLADDIERAMQKIEWCDLTGGGPAPAYLKGGFNGDIHAILRPIQRGMLQFVGFEVLAPQIGYGPISWSGPTNRAVGGVCRAAE